MGKSDRDKLHVAEAPGDGPIQRMLAECAREHRVWLIGGTLPLVIEGATPSGAAGVDRVRTRTWSSIRAASKRRATTRCICSRTTTGASATTSRAP